MNRLRRLRCAWRGFHWWALVDGTHSLYLKPTEPRKCVDCGYHDWWAWGIPWGPEDFGVAA